MGELAGIRVAGEETEGKAGISSLCVSGFAHPTMEKANGLLPCDYRFRSRQWELPKCFFVAQ